MKQRPAPILASILVAVGVALGCAPKFEEEGSLTIEGAVFTPAVCHVLAPRAAGIELVDADGTRVDLLLPHAVLPASETVSGVPQVAYNAKGKTPTKLGSCGSLTLDLGGPYGRAAGSATLDCSVKGELTFSGCL